MSLTTFIADTRKAVADDVANAGVVFAAQGTLVGVTEIDVRTGAHTFKVDEPPALGGADVAANPEALDVSRARARAAAVGETAAHRAASRTDATPRGDRDSAASTRVSTRDSSGTDGATPSSQASSSTCRDVSLKTPEAVHLRTRPGDPRPAAPAAPRSLEPAPQPQGYRCPYRYWYPVSRRRRPRRLRGDRARGDPRGRRQRAHAPAGHSTFAQIRQFAVVLAASCGQASRDQIDSRAWGM